MALPKTFLIPVLLLLLPLSLTGLDVVAFWSSASLAAAPAEPPAERCVPPVPPLRGPVGYSKGSWLGQVGGTKVHGACIVAGGQSGWVPPG